MSNDQFVRQITEAQNSMYRVAKAILKNDEDCADAISEAILHAFDKIDTLKQEKYFRTWLIRILLNECYKILNSRQKIISFEEYMEKGEETSMYSEVFEAVLKLDETYRLPFILYYVEGYSTKEIAKILNISISNVKIRLQRARLKLQEMLKGE